jgi:hypothetical protein
VLVTIPGPKKVLNIEFLQMCGTNLQTVHEVREPEYPCSQVREYFT